jgi:pimeloyl-ACP methyl ester carboxylesterase
MDDLDEVRAALGYERVNLYGISYGTRAALVYARRHPQHVRSMTLQGVAPTTRKLPLALAADAQAALDAVLHDCAADHDCRTRYGAVAATIDTVVDRLRREPVTVELEGDAAGWGGALRITEGIFVGALRAMLYGSQGAGHIPEVVAAAAQGDYGPLVANVRPFVETMGSTLHFGAFLSVTCAEDVAQLDLAAVGAASRGTLLGDRMARNHARLCQQWSTGSVPPGYAEPVRSDLPTLLFSGSADPVTPPGAAHEAARHLPHSLELTVPNAGHADAVAVCEGRIFAAFVAAGSTAGLDTSCIQPRPRRFAPPSPEPPRSFDSSDTGQFGNSLSNGDPIRWPPWRYA